MKKYITTIYCNEDGAGEVLEHEANGMEQPYTLETENE